MYILIYIHISIQAVRPEMPAPETPRVTIFRLLNSKIATFEGDPSCDSVAKRVCNDFCIVRASADMWKAYENLSQPKNWQTIVGRSILCLCVFCFSAAVVRSI